MQGRVDLPGFVLSAAAMGLIVYTLIEAPTYGWSSGRSIAGYVGFAMLAAIFAVWERRVEHPMLDVAIFKNMRFTAASGSVAIAFFGLFGFSFLIVQYFQFLHGWSALATGVHLLPIAFAVGFGSVVGTQIAVKAGTQLVVSLGLLMVMAFYVWIALVNDPTTSYAIIAAQMVLGGLGMGFTTAPATESVMGAVSLSQAGVGSAVNDSTRLIGGTLGVAVIGSVFTSVFSNDIGRHLSASANAAFGNTVRQSAGAAFAVAQKVTASGHPRASGKAGAVHSVPRSTRLPRKPSSTASTRAAWWQPASPDSACSSPRSSCPPNPSSSRSTYSSTPSRICSPRPSRPRDAATTSART